MTEEIKPALTEEQWASIPNKVYFREPRVTTEAKYGLPVGYVLDEGYGVELTEGGAMDVWDDSWAIQVSAENRHALAALALHNQSFGFTWEDVDALVSLRDDAADKPWHDAHYHASVLASLAQRITALLPPRTP